MNWYAEVHRIIKEYGRIIPTDICVLIEEAVDNYMECEGSKVDDEELKSWVKYLLNWI